MLVVFLTWRKNSCFVHGKEPIKTAEGLSIRISSIIHTNIARIASLLSHAMKLQCTRRLYFNFYGIERNFALQILDPSSTFKLRFYWGIHESLTKLLKRREIFVRFMILCVFFNHIYIYKIQFETLVWRLMKGLARS